MAQTPQAVNIFLVQEDEKSGAINLIGDAVETGDVAYIAIHTKVYDADTFKWVDDEEVYEKAEQRLLSLGATSVETAVEDLSALAAADALLLPEIYILGDRADFDPIGGQYVTYTQLDAATAKTVKSRKNEVFETLPVTEFPGYRYNVGVDMGDGLVIRISQFVFADEDGDVDDTIDAIGVKYTNKKINSLRESIKEGKISEALVDRTKATIEKLVAIEKAKKDKELSELVGKDWNKFIEDEGTFKGRVVVQKINKDSFYAQLVLDTNNDE